MSASSLLSRWVPCEKHSYKLIGWSIVIEPENCIISYQIKIAWQPQVLPRTSLLYGRISITCVNISIFTLGGRREDFNIALSWIFPYCQSQAHSPRTSKDMSC